MEPYPFLREIQSPVTDDQLTPLDPRCRVVQFRAQLTETDFKTLARFLSAYPDVTFRIYGQYQEPRHQTLEFLRHFPFVRNFQVDVYTLESLEGLNHLSQETAYLGLGETKRRFSLAMLKRFPQLKDLSLTGHTKDFDTVGDLSTLEQLTLRSITLPNLSVLTRLSKLQELRLKLGGTTDLSLLPQIGGLKYLEIWMVRGLSDLSPIAQIGSLQYLFLQALKNVEALPSLAPLRRLRRVHLETMKGLRDLAPVCEAPALEELLVLDMGHLDPNAFQGFAKHPKLKSATIGLCSQKKNSAVGSLLGLPTTPSDSDFVFQ